MSQNSSMREIRPTIPQSIYLPSILYYIKIQLNNFLKKMEEVKYSHLEMFEEKP